MMMMEELNRIGGRKELSEKRVIWGIIIACLLIAILAVATQVNGF
jgi:hypothetical protein